MVGQEQQRPNGLERPILAGKLAIPPLRAGTVVRESLLARLDDALAMKLGLVVAQAGWGKTTLLLAWAARVAGATPPCRLAWVTLDESDDDPHRFWSYVAVALHRAAVTVSDGVLSSLRVPNVDPIEFAVPQLLNDLASHAGCSVLVLDDYQSVTDRRIQESFEYFLTYLSPSVHVVLGSRWDPALPLARMRARGELIELRAADLRFSSTEAAELVSTVAGIELDPQATDALVLRTEGWAVGLKLAALSVRGGGDARARVERITADDRHIMDYLTTEVLGRLPPEQRDFLVSASALDKISGPLCDAALQRADSVAMLQDLERADLFLVALDDKRGWYRFHRLFGDALRREFNAIAPSQATEVRRRASDWYWQHGHFEDAIRTRTAAGDLAGAAELLLAAEDEFLDQGAVGTYLQLAEALGEEARRADPRLAVSMAAAAGLSGQAERVSSLLDTAEFRIDEELRPYPNWRSLAAAAAFLRTTYGYATVDGPTRGLEYARRAVEREDDPSLQGWALARFALGYALTGEGQAEEAVTELRQAWQHAGPLGLPIFIKLIISGLLNECLLISGRHEEAKALLREVLPTAEGFEHALGGAAAPAVTIVRVVQGQIAYLDGDLPQARDMLVHAAELAQIAGHPVLLIRALTALADAHFAMGDRTAARAVLQEAQEVVESWTVPRASAKRVAEAQARIGRGAARVAHRQHRLPEEFTDRELSILLKLQGPLTQREIARELYLSLNTVKGYAKSLYRKLGVTTRLEAVDRARDLGLI